MCCVENFQAISKIFTKRLNSLTESESKEETKQTKKIIEVATNTHTKLIFRDQDIARTAKQQKCNP